MNNGNAFSRLFDWLFGPESKAAMQYYKEQAVMVPFGVLAFLAFMWLLRIVGELM